MDKIQQTRRKLSRKYCVCVFGTESLQNEGSGFAYSGNSPAREHCITVIPINYEVFKNGFH